MPIIGWSIQSLTKHNNLTPGYLKVRLSLNALRSTDLKGNEKYKKANSTPNANHDSAPAHPGMCMPNMGCIIEWPIAIICSMPACRPGLLVSIHLSSGVSEQVLI